MNLELRSINVSLSLSEETYAYTAKLYRDGKHIANVSNHGTGGPDDVHPTHNTPYAVIEEIEAYFKTLPPITTEFMHNGEPFVMEQSLEHWCGDRVSEHLVARDYRRLVKNSVLIVDGNRVRKFQWKGVKAITPQHIEVIRQKFPDKVILNCLAEPEGIAMFRQVSHA